MNIIERALVDRDQEIIDFVDSPSFKVFTDIMERKYLEELIKFHKVRSEEKLEVERARLNVYLGLPTELEYLRKLIIEQRKKQREDSIKETEE